MRKLNKLSFNHSKNKFQWWKKLIIFGFIVSFGIVISSCEDDNNVNSDEYYIKYDVTSSTIYVGYQLDFTIKNENNEYVTVRTGGSPETIIGPVKKGFTATLEVNAVGETYDQLKLNAKIHVSKNDSPFALKASDESDSYRDFVALSYTIDY